MVMALMPALANSASAVASKMPQLVSAIRQYAPTAMKELSRLTGSTAPEDLAATLATTANGMGSQGLMFNAVRAGVPLDLIIGAVPLLTAADHEMLEAHHREYVIAARKAADTIVAKIPLPQVESPSAEVVRQIEQLCNMLSVTSNELADLVTGVKTISVEQIRLYQVYFKSTGKRVL